VKEKVLVESMAVEEIVVVVSLNLEVEKIPYFHSLLDIYPTYYAEIF
jgi:hypothetical protein